MSNYCENRPLPINFTPSVWSEYVAMSHASSMKTLNDNFNDSEEIITLKKQVQTMIINLPDQIQNSLYEKLHFIDAVQRLGLSCYFENEIEAALETLHSNNLSHFEHDDYDLCTVALRFRLLRQHGYNISSYVFNKFTDGDMKFKESLVKDVEGLLSLYEASHLRVHGEIILDEALIFTTKHLKSISANDSTLISSCLVQQINHSLKHPIQKSMIRREARRYITVYEVDDSHNEILLRLAKLDFNQLQLLYQQELIELARWRKDIECETNLLSFSRDRIVECYYWSVAAFAESKYSLTRMMFCKLVAILTILDDIYDSFGTPDELQLFTQALERWDISLVDKLPEYMKLCYKNITEFLSEVNENLDKERSFCIGYCKQTLIGQVKAYLQDSKWIHQKHIPTMNEYIQNSYHNAGSFTLVAFSLTGMGEVVTEESLAWAISEPKIVRAMTIIGRIMNDIGYQKSEQRKSGYIVASAVECYMKQYGTTEEEAVNELTKQVVEVWKDVNEECLKSTIPRPLLMRVLQLVRANDEIYRDGDGFTQDVLLKHMIDSLIFTPVPI